MMLRVDSTSTRGPASRRKRSARPPSGSPGSEHRPYLRFHHPAVLRRKTLSVLDALERAPDATEYREALADVVVELTHSGLDSYFMKPLALSRPGFVMQQAANLGMGGVTSLLGSAIRNVIGRMDQRQLLSVCGSIRRFMI